MSKLLKYKDDIVDKIKTLYKTPSTYSIDYDNYVNTIDESQIEYENSMYITTVIRFKSYNFDGEIKMFKKGKLLLSDEIFDVKYIVEYNKVKDSVRLKIRQKGVSYSRLTKKYFYYNNDKHVVVINNKGYSYVIRNGKPNISNYLISSIITVKEDNLKLFVRNEANLPYLYNIRTWIINNNPYTSYVSNIASIMYKKVFKLKDIFKYDNINDLLDNTVYKEFDKNNFKKGNVFNFISEFYNKFDKESVDIINKLLADPTFDTGDYESSYGLLFKFLQKAQPITPIAYTHGDIYEFNCLFARIQNGNYKLSLTENIVTQIVNFNKKIKNKLFTSKTSKLLKEDDKCDLVNKKKIEKILNTTNYDFQVVKGSDKETFDFIKDYVVNKGYQGFNSYLIKNKERMFIKIKEQGILIGILYFNKQFSWFISDSKQLNLSQETYDQFNEIIKKKKYHFPSHVINKVFNFDSTYYTDVSDLQVPF
jgi:hypothetical protein